MVRSFENLPVRVVAFAILLLMLGEGCQKSEPPADLVLRGGKVVTVNQAQPEAEAVAVRNDTIAAVGSAEEIDRLVGSRTTVIELEGRTVIPGFIEGHGHFMKLGNARLILDLRPASSWDDIVAMVSGAVQTVEPGEWITGRGWHQEKWDSTPEGSVDGVPTHHSLSRVSPGNPVYLEHVSGHAAFVNAEAMRRSAISAETRNPAGGEIVRDLRGQPTGYLIETAEDAVVGAMRKDLSRRSDEQVVNEKRRKVELAGHESISKGITSFHDTGESFETIDFLRDLVDEGNLPLRLYVMVSGDSVAKLEERLADYWMIDHGKMLTVRSIKLYIDGALGSHGAWLLEPYDDIPATSGLNTVPIDSVRRAAAIANRLGFQVSTHAIGDRANKVVLDIYESMFGDDLSTDRRWRIEHAQHLDPADIPRFHELGVIASMQAVHATSDGPWVPKRIGEERARAGAYVWQSLWESGVVVTNGTDTPTEDIDPIANFYASVSRKLSDGTPFYPDQRLTRQQALEAYTINNAYAAFQEDRLGSIEVGKWADLTVLSRDIMTVPVEEILGTRVDYTIVGGEVVYQRESTR